MSITCSNFYNSRSIVNEILRVCNDLQISISTPGADMSQALSQAGYSRYGHSVPNLHDEYSLQLHHQEGVTVQEGISTSKRKFTDHPWFIVFTGLLFWLSLLLFKIWQDKKFKSFYLYICDPTIFSVHTNVSDDHLQLKW